MNDLSRSKTVESSSGRGRLTIVLWVIFLVLLCGIASQEALRMHFQRGAVDAIETIDGEAWYASNCNVIQNSFNLHGHLTFGFLSAHKSLFVKDSPDVLDRIRSVIGRDFCDEIRAVELRDQKLTDGLLSQLHYLNEIEYLNFYFCEPIGKTGYAPLGEITSLKWLFLYDSSVKDSDLAHFANLENLVWLDMNFSKITDAGVRHLGNLKQLEVLSLYDSEITDIGLAHLGKLTNLRRLDLSSTLISDAGLIHLKDMKQLQKLWLRDSQIQGEGLIHLKGLAKLEELNSPLKKL